MLYVLNRSNILSIQLNTELMNTCISFFHALFVCIYGGLYLSNIDITQVNNITLVNNALVISSTYFMFDTIAMIITKQYIFIIHHILALIPILYSYYYNIYGSIVFLFLFLGEISNPIMQFIEINKKCKIINNYWEYTLEYYNNVVFYSAIRFFIAPPIFLYVSRTVNDNILLVFISVSMSILTIGSYQWVVAKYKISPNWEEYMYYS